MNSFKKIINLIALTCLYLPSAGQDLIPLGTWRSHVAYNHANQIMISSNRVYCVTDNGLFYFDKSDNSLGTISKVNGLSDVIITAIGNIGKGELIIGYDNGNLDILQGNQVLNFTGIKDTPVNYSKSINDIVVSGNKAYLANAYGIIVFDLNKNEIFETWRDLGANGETLTVNSLAVLRDTIYAATDSGVISGALNPSLNLVDYRNWIRYDTLNGLPGKNASFIRSFNSEIITAVQDRYLYTLRGNSWQMIRDYFPGKIISLSSSANYSSVISSSGIELLDGNYQFTAITDPLIIQPRFCTPDIDSRIWIADGLNGMITNYSGEYRNMYPDGPFFNEIYSIKYLDDKIIILPNSGVSSGLPLRNEDGYSVFEQGRWTSYNNSAARNHSPGTSAMDLSDVDYNAISGNMVFASFGYGLVNWNGLDNYEIIDENNPGSLLINSDPPGRNTLVSSIVIDETGKNYFLNYKSPEPLLSINTSGQWGTYNTFYSLASSVVQLLKTSAGEIWMRINPSEGGGLLIYDEKSGKSRMLSKNKDQGGLPGDKVYDMALDLDGMLWIATDKGVAYFPYPGDAISDQELNALVPVFDNRYLLRGELINCIAVDGGNNKWVGTEMGAWLFNSDGSKLIDNFNSVNSPLFSDEITDIGINDKTGEVFFATSKGLLSFRGTSTKSESGTDHVKIFPNPVSPGFTGLVGIEGLPASSTIKITDITGKLIFETISEGGTASWNTLDPAGKKVNTGVYLVFSATSDGNNTFVGKLAVVR